MFTAFLVSRAVTADELAQGFWRFILPLKKIGVPANDIGLAILIALRFIPAIFRLQQQVKMAQTARGATFDGGLITRTRKLIPLLVPVTAAALRRSDTLADALTVRGWGCSTSRTYYSHGSFRRVDYLILAGAVVWFALIIGAAL
jgi:energy-coupling factor transporter transmembrane protein EcfT